LSGEVEILYVHGVGASNEAEKPPLPELRVGEWVAASNETEAAS